jgi:hypothetical protein
LLALTIQSVLALFILTLDAHACSVNGFLVEVVCYKIAAGILTDFTRHSKFRAILERNRTGTYRTQKIDNKIVSAQNLLVTMAPQTPHYPHRLIDVSQYCILSWFKSAKYLCLDGIV